MEKPSKGVWSRQQSAKHSQGESIGDLLKNKKQTELGYSTHDVKSLQILIKKKAPADQSESVTIGPEEYQIISPGLQGSVFVSTEREGQTAAGATHENSTVFCNRNRKLSPIKQQNGAVMSEIEQRPQSNFSQVVAQNKTTNLPSIPVSAGKQRP